ncbi:Polyisoprenoid-binding protein YceI [Streptomyces sp. Ag82_O1-12]|uniref:YceI family protein n=1 Tax=unclassified Streptomyces TaxID=2593676 RepID=UPI000BD6E59C|nr:MULTISPECIES: YceI family protein [unclassified Streptomyces]SMQ17688.1 Polyisoprenoid-binding protein YceI [Streptomyces sp. Ag82_O1-12]SOD46724.1 Polyisoprenoid-binding protein YceI [Streptomyces sp. Ag82_G6-1]
MTTATALGELTGDYVLDTDRTRIGFTARAALVGKVRGRFEAFEGSARLDGGSPSQSAVRLTIRAASVQTRNTKRDDHLRSGDFLDAESHPALTFASTRVEPTGGTGFRVTGDLTVRGVTRQVTVDFELTGSGRDPQGGGHLAAFTGRTVIDRHDWGVSGARGMVGRKVTLEFDVMAVRRS